MTRIIMVTYDATSWQSKEDAPLFAATLAAKMSENVEVVLVDGSYKARALKHLGLDPLLDKSDAFYADRRFWHEVSKGTPSNDDMLFGSFGELGDDVGGIYVATKNPNVVRGDEVPKEKTRSRGEIVSMFRAIEGDDVTDVVVVLAGYDTPLMIAGFGFADCVLHVSETYHPGVYRQVLGVRDMRRDKHFPAVPVFYGETPSEDQWKNVYPPNTSRQLVMSHSWNDRVLTRLADAFSAGNGWKSVIDGSSDRELSYSRGNREAFMTPTSKSSTQAKASPLITAGRFVVPPAGVAGMLAFGPAMGLADALTYIAALATAVVGVVIFTGLSDRSKAKNAARIEAAEKAKIEKAEQPVQIGSSYDKLWDELEARRDKVLDSWVEYELDASLGLRYPTILDSSVPATGAFHKALGKVEMLEGSKDKTLNPVNTEYFEAVQEMELAFKVAEEHARKMGRSVWTADQRPKVEKAERLLAMAMDESASTNERQTAYRQALSSLEGVASIPQKAAYRIEAAIALIEA